MTNPYKVQPDKAFWRRAISSIPVEEVDPVSEAPWKISPSDRIMTAGSCFAQHIARHLSASGYGYFVTETAHPLFGCVDTSDYNYGTYTARYGNIYTVRQLAQLFARVYGRFRPIEDVWVEDDGRLIDPFRPQIQPHGFQTAAEYESDRKRHFQCVREAFETTDVFIFTLGLTEAWMYREDGAVFTLCPGVAGGVFDPDRHRFHNFSVAEVVEDLRVFLDDLKSVNSRARVLLTVSPVPLVATATSRHILAATTYSKSVLRVACEEIMQERSNVCYFPSYEIVAGHYNRGRYFREDGRSVCEAGVSHVMSVFFRHFTDRVDAVSAPRAPQAPKDDHTIVMQQAIQERCDEMLLDRNG